jgi:hypothetical protein
MSCPRGFALFDATSEFRLRKRMHGVNAQEFGRLLALSIRGSLWRDGGCIFGAVAVTVELLALGVNCCAGAQKFERAHRGTAANKQSMNTDGHGLRRMNTDTDTAKETDG